MSLTEKVAGLVNRRPGAVDHASRADQAPDRTSAGPVQLEAFDDAAGDVIPPADPPGPSASTAPPPPAAASLRIVVEPTASRRKWVARLDDRVLCVSVWPFVKSARLLLAECYPADTVIEMRRPNADEWALRGRLGAVAATVIDGETVSRRAKNGSPVRFPGIAAGTTPAGGAS